MCNRVVQKEKVIKPGECLRTATVTMLLKGPGGEFEMPAHCQVFEGAAFAGPANSPPVGVEVTRLKLR